LRPKPRDSDARVAWRDNNQIAEVKAREIAVTRRFATIFASDSAREEMVQRNFANANDCLAHKTGEAIVYRFQGSEAGVAEEERGSLAAKITGSTS